MLRRRSGFTLAEVLIALLLVGILSSISIQTLRNRDNSAEYEALRNKAVTNIQGVMHEALFTKKSSEIFDDNFETLWGEVNKRLSTDTGSIKSKDGAINITTSQVMRDGVNYAYTPKEGNSHVAEITIDVNGSKAPNEEGRDIYKYSMDKFGNILLATLPDAPNKEYCPDGVTVKNSDGSNCPKCTDGSMVTTPDRSNCPKCPNGTTERNADGSNCDKCANGEMANANRSNCPKCANGQEANVTRSNCPKCPDGTTEKIDVAGSNCPVECKGNHVKVGNACQCPEEYSIENGDYCYHECEYVMSKVPKLVTDKSQCPVKCDDGQVVPTQADCPVYYNVKLSSNTNETYNTYLLVTVDGKSHKIKSGYPTQYLTLKVKKGTKIRCYFSCGCSGKPINWWLNGKVKYQNGGDSKTFTIEEDSVISANVLCPKN